MRTNNSGAANFKTAPHLCGFLTPPVAGADLRAALVASCLRGALPPVDLRAVCFVRAMAAVDEYADRAEIGCFGKTQRTGLFYQLVWGLRIATRGQSLPAQAEQQDMHFAGEASFSQAPVHIRAKQRRQFLTKL